MRERWLCCSQCWEQLCGLCGALCTGMSGQQTLVLAWGNSCVWCSVSRSSTLGPFRRTWGDIFQVFHWLQLWAGQNTWPCVIITAFWGKKHFLELLLLQKWTELFLDSSHSPFCCWLSVLMGNKWGKLHLCSAVGIAGTAACLQCEPSGAQQGDRNTLNVPLTLCWSICVGSLWGGGCAALLCWSAGPFVKDRSPCTGLWDQTEALLTVLGLCKPSQSLGWGRVLFVPVSRCVGWGWFAAGNEPWGAHCPQVTPVHRYRAEQGALCGLCRGQWRSMENSLWVPMRKLMQQLTLEFFTGDMCCHPTAGLLENICVFVFLLSPSHCYDCLAFSRVWLLLNSSVPYPEAVIFIYSSILI